MSFYKHFLVKKQKSSKLKKVSKQEYMTNLARRKAGSNRRHTDDLDTGV